MSSLPAHIDRAVLRGIQAGFDKVTCAAMDFGEALREMIEALTRCPVHGPMRWREQSGRWECAGWDGEGCPSYWPPDD